MSIVKYLAYYYIKLLVDSAAESAEQSVSVPYIACLMFFLLFTEGLRRYKSYYQFDLLPKIKKYIYDFFISRMVNYQYHYYYKRTSGLLLNALRNLSDGSEEYFISLKDVFWKSCVVFMSAVGSAVIIHPHIGLILAIWICLWTIICVSYIKVSYQYSLNLYTEKNSFISYIGDILNNIITIKTFNSAEYECEKSKVHSQQFLNIELENNFLFFKINVVNTLLFMGILVYLFYFLHAAKLATAGNFLLLFQSLMDIYSNLDDLNENFCDISDVSGQINTSMDVLYRELPVQEYKQKGFLATKGDIVLRNIMHRYPNSNGLTFQIDGELHIKGGSCIAIVGTSGAGKSTLFNLLLRLISLDEGDIIIDGQNIKEFNNYEVRSAFALVPQELSLFHRSALENIAYGSFDQTIDRVSGVVQRIQLTEVINNLQDGYNSVYGKNCNFSGGQKQRIVIARGLLRDAKIFLFDESTSALDVKTEYEILSSIHAITKGYTKFIIAHRLKTVKDADLILVFDQGRLVQKGTHEELMKNLDGLYASLMDLM